MDNRKLEDSGTKNSERCGRYMQWILCLRSSWLSCAPLSKVAHQSRTASFDIMFILEKSYDTPCFTFFLAAVEVEVGKGGLLKVQD